MQINILTPGLPVTDISVSGAVVTFGEVTIDGDKEQRDHAVDIDIFRDADGKPSLSGVYRLATVRILPRSYHSEVRIIDEEEVTVDVADPLDTDTIIIQLLPA